MPRSRNVSRPSRAFFGAALASITSALLLLSGPPARSAGPGMWSPNSDWRGQQDDRFYAAHMILQPGNGTYHSRILWFRSERDQELKGGQWGWTPGGDGCTAYPSSNFEAIAVPLSGLDLFCSGHSLPMATPSPSPGPTQTEGLPTAFALHAARPNPFSRATTIQFEVPRVAEVRIEIFDVQGRRIATLVDGERPAGRHSVAWDGRADHGRAEASVYICRMTAGEFRAERRVTLVP